MPGRSTPSSVKNPKMYEDLRDKGESKEKAARISNAAAKGGGKSVSKKGGESGSYDNWSVDDLRKRAKELGIKGYSGKRKGELVKMLRDH